MPNTSDLVPPAMPAMKQRQHEGDQLVVVGAVAERGGARLVLADRLQHLAERRMHDAVDQQEEDQEHDGDDAQYIAMSGRSEITPNSAPRGTCWMPSSPPVNGACRQKK